MIEVKFFGAAKTVTGSHYYITTSKSRFVIDCGMFQGPDVEHLNLNELEYDASKVDFAILTHAHIDHSGMLPKLTKGGFKGKIFATSHTIQIATELLLDSAKIQENSYQKGLNYGKYTGIKAIVYNTFDAEQTILKFSGVDYLEEFSPTSDIKVKFIRAGHILGAASIHIEINDEGVTKTFLFSGDLGREKSHIIETFDHNYKLNPDYIFIESLYGGQIHPDRDESARQLIREINTTLKNGGSAYIPVFAVQRTQEVLNDIKNAKLSGDLDNNIDVWLDSPLAQRVTAIYSRALHTESDPFYFDKLHYVKKFKESLSLANKSGNIVIAGSGMADGGRIMNHLVKALPNSKNSVLFVGFQAEGTLGRDLISGMKRVNIDKTSVKVNATIHHLQGFSAHGDTNDYTHWIKQYTSSNLKKVFLVHAEEERAIMLKAHFSTLGINNCVIPSMEESFKL